LRARRVRSRRGSACRGSVTLLLLVHLNALNALNVRRTFSLRTPKKRFWI
jgi:hypothetical protein